MKTAKEYSDTAKREVSVDVDALLAAINEISESEVGPPSVLTVTRSFTFIVFLLWLCASVEQFRFLAAPGAREC